LTTRLESKTWKHEKSGNDNGIDVNSDEGQGNIQQAAGTEKLLNCLLHYLVYVEHYVHYTR